MRRDAFTLLELTIVVLLLVILASALALQHPQASGPQKVALAAEEVAAALRFARSEALRTGEVHGASVSYLTGKVDVWKADLSTGLSAPDVVLTNPFDKRPYDFLVGDLPGAAGVELTNPDHAFTYRGLGTAVPGIVFDATGLPFWLLGGVRYPLQAGVVGFRHGSAESKLGVSPSGRVRVL